MDRRLFILGGVAALASVGNAEAKKKRCKRHPNRKGCRKMTDPRYLFFINNSKPGVIYILDTQNQDEATLQPQLVAAGWRQVTKKRAGEELGGDQATVDQAKAACMFGQVGRAGSRYTCLGQGVS